MGPKEIAIIALSVLSFLLLIIVVILTSKVKRHQRAIALVYNIIDDNTEAEIYGIVDNAKERIAELEKNEIAEYNRLRDRINKEASTQISQIEKQYQLQHSSMASNYNRQKASANRNGDARGMSQIQLQMNNEGIALRKQADSEKENVKAQQKSALQDLKDQFADVLDEYKRLKVIKKDVKVLVKIFAKAKKSENLID